MEEKIWYKSYASGVKKTIDYEKVTISEALTRTTRKFPSNTALNYMGNIITYRELNSLVNRFARALQDLGIKAGDKVALCLPNIPQVVIANLAIQRIGAVTVQNNPLYTERELTYQLDDSDSRIVITLTLLIPRMQKIKPNTKLEKIIGCHINTYLPFPKKQLFPLVKKDMIIAGGYNIYPLELDDVLMDHPKILEACTIGVPHDYRGETVKAFIVAKAGENLTEDELVGFCKENLAAYKVPEIIEFVDELPKSAVGKILRRKLKEMELAKIKKQKDRSA